MRRCALAAVLLAAFGHADEAEIQARMRWAEARLALKEGDPEAALEKFEEAIKGLPSDPALLYEAARCAFDTGDLERAETWITAVVRTEDEAFKAKPEYQEAFTLATKVKAAREAEKDSAEDRRETAKYSKQIELIEKAIGRVRSGKSLDAFASHTFVNIHMDGPHPLKEEFRVPHVFSGSAYSPGFSCRFEIEGIATEKTATALINRVLGIVKRHAAEWERLAAALERPARILKSDDEPAFADDSFHGKRKVRAVAYALETERTTVRSGFLDDGEIETSTSRQTLVGIALYADTGKDREVTYRVVVGVSSGF